jgi:hypothetical protein
VHRLRILAIALVAVLAAACGSSAPKAPVTTPSPESTIAPATARSPLRCHAHATSKWPRARTTVKIQVRTAAHAWVTATEALASPDSESAAGRASVKGNRTLRFRVGNATSAAQVIVDVYVSRHGRTGTCQASFGLRPTSASAAAPTQLPASPSPTPSVAASPPPATAASCYPLSNEGTCYEPGEFCRASDHGVSGVAGDGKKIVCQDNDGWRWEPV